MIILAAILLLVIALIVVPGGTVFRGRDRMMAVFAVSILGIIALGYLTYQDFEKKFLAEIENRLTSITDLKVGELVLYRKERLSDAAGFMGNVAFSRLARSVAAELSDPTAEALLRNWLTAFAENDLFRCVHLLDTRGRTRLSVPETGIARAGIPEMRAQEILASGIPVIQDLYRDETDDEILLAIQIPILDTENSDAPLGILVFHIDPWIYLYPFIKGWPIPSSSAETLLVRREGSTALFLNDLRFRADSALKLRVPLDEADKRPAARAALGQEGVMEGVDYRGERVIASLRGVPESPWAIVAKMDTKEAYGPLRERKWTIIAVVAALVVTATATAFFLRKIGDLDFYREKYQTLQELQKTTAFLENLLNYASTPIIVWDSELRISRFNRAFEALTGLSAAEMLGNPPDRLFPPKSRERSLGYLKRSAGGDRWEALEIDILAKDGTIRRLLWNSSPIYSSDGAECIATIAQGVDITEAKEAESRLFEQLEELRRWQSITLDREQRILEMKAEVNGLLAAQGKPPRYAVGANDAG